MRKTNREKGYCTQRNFGKNVSFFISRLARPICCCRIFLGFRISFIAFRRFFRYCYFTCFRFIWSRVFRNRFGYRYIAWLNALLVKNSTRRFDALCLNLLESRALLWQSFLKNYFARPNNTWNSRWFTSCTVRNERNVFSLTPFDMQNCFYT